MQLQRQQRLLSPGVWCLVGPLVWMMTMAAAAVRKRRVWRSGSANARQLQQLGALLLLLLVLLKVQLLLLLLLLLQDSQHRCCASIQHQPSQGQLQPHSGSGARPTLTLLLRTLIMRAKVCNVLLLP